MALTFSTLTKPTNPQVVDPSTGEMREEWQLYFDRLTTRLNGAVSALSSDPAPADGEYVVAAAHASLTAERVATDTATVDVDMGTAAQAKWNVLEVPGIASTGLVVRSAAATYLARSLAAPAAGITISNGDGVAGNPTLALANDLAGLEGLASTGLAARTAADTWAARTLTAGAGVVIANGDGVSGNPTISGFVLQVLQTTNTANTTCGNIPNDDTVPLVSEGTEILTRAITPASTSSRIKVDVVVWGATSGTQGAICALFRGSTCINAMLGPNLGSGGDGRPIMFSYIDSPATASSVTYSVRAGNAAVSPATFTINGGAGARKFGGVSACTLILTELAS